MRDAMCVFEPIWNSGSKFLEALSKFSGLKVFDGAIIDASWNYPHAVDYAVLCCRVGTANWDGAGAVVLSVMLSLRSVWSWEISI